MKIIEKPWGKEEILETNEHYTVKRLTMFNGHKCSLQYHNFKKETIYSIEKTLTIEIGDGEFMDLIPGESITINPKQVHRMMAKYGDAIYLECSTSELEDVVRIQDDYNRV